MKKFLMLMLVSSFLSLSAFAEGKIDPNCDEVILALQNAQSQKAAVAVADTTGDEAKKPDAQTAE